MLRRPEGGLGYELFDSAVLVLGLSLFWYITTPPASSTDAALSDTLSLVTEPRVWGYVLATVAATASIASFSHTWRILRAGYIGLFIVTAGWGSSLVVGTIASWPTWDMAGKSLGVALVFGWVSRRLVYEVIRESARQGQSVPTRDGGA